MATGQAALYVARPLTSYRLLGLGAPARDVGLVAASFAVVPLFVTLPLGRLVDRRRSPSLLAYGAVLQIAGCLLLAAVRAPVALAAATAVLGLGHLGIALGSQAVVARESTEERHDRDFGLLTAGAALGQLAGPLVGGGILAGRSGRALVPATTDGMLTAAAIGGLAVLFALLVSRDPADGGRERRPETTGVLEILSTPGIAPGILVSIAVLSAAEVFTAYLPVLGEQRGIAPATIGILLALRSAFSLTSRVGIVTLVRLLGRVRLIAVSALAAAAALAGIALAHDLFLLAVLTAVVGAGLGFGQPLSMTIVVQQVPEQARATALALRLAGNRAGQVAAPAAAGLIAGATGVAGVFVVLGSLLAVTATALGRPALRQAVSARRASP